MPSHEACHRGRQVALGRRPGFRRGHEGGSLEKDLLVQLLEFRARIDAQLVHQDAAAFLKDPQSLPLPSRPVQGQHQVAAQPLPQRIGGHERPQLSHEPGMPAEGQLRFRLHLDGADPLLLKPGDFLTGEALNRELRERRAAPQAERLLQQRQPAGLIRGVGPPGLLHQPPESAGIKLPGTYVEHVAGLAGNEPAGAGRDLQGLADPGHHYLQGVRRVAGKVTAPQFLDQPVR